LKEAQEEYTFDISKIITASIWWLLTSIEVKGRTAARDHSRVVRALKKEAFLMDTDFNGRLMGGKFTLDEDRFKYLKKICDQQMEGRGIEGQHVEGIDALLDMMDEIETEKRIEKKKEEEQKKDLK